MNPYFPLSTFSSSESRTYLENSRHLHTSPPPLKTSMSAVPEVPALLVLLPGLDELLVEVGQLNQVGPGGTVIFFLVFIFAAKIVGNINIPWRGRRRRGRSRLASFSSSSSFAEAGYVCQVGDVPPQPQVRGRVVELRFRI